MNKYHPPIYAISQKQHFTTLHAKAGEQRRMQQQQPNQRTRRRPSQQAHQSTQYSTKSKSPKLQRPEIIFSNNHLLICNKPAGWKSQPGGTQNSASDPKCLLTYLKSQSLGGGSQNNFLMPTHRLDQPCTGVLIFAKNGKAGSRVQVAWSKRKVEKCYWVVVEGGKVDSRGMDGLELLRSRSMKLGGRGNGKKNGPYRLSAILKSTGGKGRNGRGGRASNAGGSVMVQPLPPNHSSSDTANSNSNGRECHIEWEHLLTLPATKTSAGGTRHLLSVRTDTGAKHQVRALLALAGGAPIAGDLRYGNKNNSQYYRNDQSGYRQGMVDQPLPDGSVALHARSVFLPSLSLGGMDFLKDEPFVATIPKQWRDYFGIAEEDVGDL
jgi:23S rRNA-/tRNA-specific pseudouridylate synthase